MTDAQKIVAKLARQNARDCFFCGEMFTGEQAFQAFGYDGSKVYNMASILGLDILPYKKEYVKTYNKTMKYELKKQGEI